MTNSQRTLERELERLHPPRIPFEQLERRRERKQRNQRVAAGVLGIVVFAVVTIGFVRLIGSERGPVIGPATSPSPTASPSPVTSPPPPFTDRFDSPLHGLSIGYPSGWRTRAATEPWRHDAAATEPWGYDELAFGAPDVDVIFDPTLQDDLYFALVSEPLDGQVWPPDGICSTASGGSGGSTKFDGIPAWVGSCGYDVAGDQVVHERIVFVETATRGYIIRLYVGDPRLLETYDGDWFEAAIETVDLRPEDAVDAFSPSEPP